MNDIFHLICLPATDKGAIEAKIGKIDTYFHRHTDRQTINRWTETAYRRRVLE